MKLKATRALRLTGKLVLRVSSKRRRHYDGILAEVLEVDKASGTMVIALYQDIPGGVKAGYAVKVGEIVEVLEGDIGSQAKAFEVMDAPVPDSGDGGDDDGGDEDEGVDLSTTDGLRRGLSLGIDMDQLHGAAPPQADPLPPADPNEGAPAESDKAANPEKAAEAYVLEVKIRSVVAELDQEDLQHFTSKGSPRVRIVSDRVGVEVTSQQIRAALDEG